MQGGERAGKVDGWDRSRQCVAAHSSQQTPPQANTQGQQGGTYSGALATMAEVSSPQTDRGLMSYVYIWRVWKRVKRHRSPTVGSFQFKLCCAEWQARHAWFA